MARDILPLDKDTCLKNSTCQKFFCLNIQSLRSKLNLLDAFCCDKNFDFLCLQEHWLNDNEMNSYIVEIAIF